MRLFATLMLLHGLGTAALATGPDSPLTTQLGPLEKRGATGQKQMVLFPELLSEFHYHVAACVGAFKPKNTASIAKADAKAFQDCIKRCFNENIQEPLMRKLYPNEQLSSCK